MNARFDREYGGSAKLPFTCNCVLRISLLYISNQFLSSCDILHDLLNYFIWWCSNTQYNPNIKQYR